VDGSWDLITAVPAISGTIREFFHVTMPLYATHLELAMLHFLPVVEVETDIYIFTVPGKKGISSSLKITLTNLDKFLLFLARNKLSNFHRNNPSI